MRAFAIVASCALAYPSCEQVETPPSDASPGSEAPSPTAAAAPATEESVRRMMELTNVPGQMETMMQEMQAQYARMGLESDFFDDLDLEARLDELLDQMVPIYQKHLSEGEVRAINEFYASPAGRSLIEKMPQIMSEGMRVGAEWGRSLFEEHMEAEPGEAPTIVPAPPPPPPSDDRPQVQFGGEDGG